MAAGPAKFNNRRYDLSDRLIHFFRDVDLTSDSSPDVPEDWGYASIVEDWEVSAHFLLRHAIRQGRLWATWSVRNGRPTIYGSRPAVCFTDMPIPAFVEAGRDRAAKREAIAPCALVLPKRRMWEAGARPAIYGLDASAGAHMRSNGWNMSFSKEDLPSREQYRYVTFDPGRVDWMHEREWRWPLSGTPWSDPDSLPPTHSDAIPGLALDDPHLSGIGVIVGTEAEAQSVIHDILTKVDRGDILQTHYQFIMAHEALSDWTSLRSYDAMEDAILANLIDLSDYHRIAEADAARIVADIDRVAAQVEAGATDFHAGFPAEPGGCWLWITGNQSPLTRALVKAGRARVNLEGRYLVTLPQIDPTRHLQQRQEMVALVAAEIDRSHGGHRSTYYSVTGSWKPDGICAFHGDIPDDPFFNNYGSYSFTAGF
ncbi:DUF4427 domain-containing protein [Sphingomonas ginsenosidivorax]|nr:DUF4427 domain-containing protein [Sphingomonas ginsenosidivorax]